MNCPFCFNPFIKEIPNFIKTKELLKKCKEIDVKVLSIGGGDPLMYDEILEIIDYAFFLGFEIHIDTNCHFLTKEKLDRLNSKVSLLGIPIDGSNAVVHNLMRENTKNFDLVIEKLELLNSYDIPIKINTVVSRINGFDIANIRNILSKYKIKIWSLYQFWPLNVSDETKNLFEISNEDFLDICNLIHISDNNYIIEVTPYKSRYQTSLFSSPNGLLYIHDPNDIKKYLFIGSIFEENLETNLLKNNMFTTIRTDVKGRYNSFNF